MKNGKRYNVIVSREAEETLLYHVEFLSRVSISAADRMVDEFDEAIDSLSSIPQRCPLYEYQDADNNIRKLLFYKRYELIFRIEGNTVYIDTVNDCRQEK